MVSIPAVVVKRTEQFMTVVLIMPVNLRHPNDGDIRIFDDGLDEERCLLVKRPLM